MATVGSVVISNGKVIVNEKTMPEDTKDINIVINGHIETRRRYL
jgi:ribosome-associated protein YbcJ (S4-like RNA binding protein)